MGQDAQHRKPNDRGFSPKWAIPAAIAVLRMSKVLDAFHVHPVDVLGDDILVLGEEGLRMKMRDTGKENKDRTHATDDEVKFSEHRLHWDFSIARW